ncbi:SDR family NAD(P)-dependent oxidoreductase [Bailinhaonella thermotolerans]|uniref:SDR family NAD(P)-dependent oxidoreductase n=1 Tax=Bailinhaonella thermotolerans TaxID=1070861 RepID=A0A3A4AAU5_9ACTN|nr:SDR family NAD(P)-dependent oxidoreductase [Bailinhaonella thermotolerans]RJL23170.1 SDR family NAD(P)-dependent oxidoreductase [Bailinhaonella thermotolerans]
MSRAVPAAAPGTALVTGASAGLGREFARQLAAAGHDLVLVARDGQRLSQVAAALRTGPGHRVETLRADLATAEGRTLVIDRLRRPERPIDLLVNNAGLGYSTPTSGNTVEMEEYLLTVNAVAKVSLAVAAVQAMIGRGRGAIINVASVAAYGPAWLDSTYGASKACVLAFSEAMAHSARVRESGVRVMALCPGDMRTEFNARAGIPDSTTPGWRWLPAEKAVAQALRDLRRGRTVSTPGATYKVLGLALRHLPRRLAARFALDFSRLPA